MNRFDISAIKISIFTRKNVFLLFYQIINPLNVVPLRDFLMAFSFARSNKLESESYNLKPSCFVNEPTQSSACRIQSFTYLSSAYKKTARQTEKLRIKFRSSSLNNKKECPIRKSVR